MSRLLAVMALRGLALLCALSVCATVVGFSLASGIALYGQIVGFEGWR